MAILSVTKVQRAGVDPGFVAASVGGDEFTNTGKELIGIKTTTNACTVTIASTVTEAGAGTVVQDDSVVVPTSAERWMGSYFTYAYNDTNNRVQLTYSDVTGVSVAVIEMGDGK